MKNPIAIKGSNGRKKNSISVSLNSISDSIHTWLIHRWFSNELIDHESFISCLYP
jgi:hypothetical protein